MPLLTHHNEDCNLIEVGVDEAGRGPLFGRLYCAAVIWPRDVHSSLVKDSKKFSKASDREKAAEFVKQNAIAYGIAYVEPEDIDKINIYQAVMLGMHDAIRDTYINPDHILADGNKFKAFTDDNGEYCNYTTVVGGDNKYYSIAAASILAKTAHDNYIKEMCDKYPILDRYDLRNNQGYGSSTHMEAIKQYGITQYHRRSFKPCQEVPIQYI